MIDNTKLDALAKPMTTRSISSMVKSPSKPDDCAITESETSNGMCYQWETPSAGFLGSLMTAFLAIWLCGWFVGLLLTIVELFDISKLGPNEMFLELWFIGWLLGGFYAGYLLYFLNRPLHPESVILKKTLFHMTPAHFLLSMSLIEHGFHWLMVSSGYLSVESNFALLEKNWEIFYLKRMDINIDSTCFKEMIELKLVSSYEPKIVNGLQKSFRRGEKTARK